MAKEDFLFLAALKVGTYSLGPGYRAVIWVQGCPFHCKGCISPEWIKPGGISYPVDEIAEKVLAEPLIEGLTISGGEPMLQAGALTNFVSAIKEKRSELNIICFTGFLYQQLLLKPPSPVVRGFINLIDLLIDGPYIEALNDDKGLRGSSNQEFHFLTDKFKKEDFAKQPRKIEIDIHDGNAFIIGVPPKKLTIAWENAMENILGGWT